MALRELGNIRRYNLKIWLVIYNREIKNVKAVRKKVTGNHFIYCFAKAGLKDSFPQLIVFI